MDQHPYGAFRSPQDVADLGGAQLFDEAEQHRTPALFRQLVDGAPDSLRLVPGDRCRGRIISSSDGTRQLERRRRPSTVRPSAVAEQVARDPKQPDAEGGAAFGIDLAEARQPAE